MKKTLTFAAIAALSFWGSAQAQDFAVGDLTISNPMAFETAPTARAGGGFMTITNTGTQADTLIGVKADYPKVEIHTTEYSDDGVAKMIHIGKIEIPAGESVELAPGGLHVMFMGLNGNAFKLGEEVPATLVFENAGEVEVVFTIEARGDGHGGHGSHSN